LTPIEKIKLKNEVITILPSLAQTRTEWRAVKHFAIHKLCHL